VFQSFPDSCTKEYVRVEYRLRCTISKDVPAFTEAAIIFAAGERKKISCPSRDQRGQSSPSVETCHFPEAFGKLCT
jgi:hypothetical protein